MSVRVRGNHPPGQKKNMEKGTGKESFANRVVPFYVADWDGTSGLQLHIYGMTKM
jgi:hypothetical protein